MFLWSGANVYGPGIAMATCDFRGSLLLLRLRPVNETFNNPFPAAQSTTCALNHRDAEESLQSGVPAFPPTSMEVVKKKGIEWFSAAMLWLSQSCCRCAWGAAQSSALPRCVSTQLGIFNPPQIHIWNRHGAGCGCGCGFGCAGLLGSHQVASRLRTRHVCQQRVKADASGRSGRLWRRRRARISATRDREPPPTSSEVGASEDSRLKLRPG